MDERKLRDEMKRKNVTVNEMCSELKMSRSAFYRKCIGKSEFTLREMRHIVGFLHIENPEKIFFVEEVS